MRLFPVLQVLTHKLVPDMSRTQNAADELARSMLLLYYVFITF